MSRTRWDSRKLEQAVKFANFRNLGQAGAIVRKLGAKSLKKSPRKSAAGTPPNTRKGALPKAILYAVEEGRRVVVGPAYHLMKNAGRAHEKGGKFRGDVYEKRPFMVPALLRVRSQIPSIWRDSVRG